MPVDFWSVPRARTPKIHLLQNRLDIAHSDCEFYKAQLLSAQYDTLISRSAAAAVQAENRTVLIRLRDMDEELQRMRNIPMQAEELLEEHRGECLELRERVKDLNLQNLSLEVHREECSKLKEKVNDLNLHNASLAVEVGRLREQLVWERRERARKKGMLEKRITELKNSIQ